MEQYTIDELRKMYLDMLNTQGKMSKINEGWMPEVSTKNKTVTYYIKNQLYISIKFLSPQTYERTISDGCRETESDLEDVPYNRKGEPDLEKIIKQNRTATKTFLEN